MSNPHPRNHRSDFDPVPHESQLVAIVEDILAAEDVDDRLLDRIAKAHPRGGVGLFSRSEIIAGFRQFARERGWGIDEAAFVARLRMRRVRTQSGVTPVTVLTKPFPCPGKCIFCPNDVRMPKSYLASEPGAQRAEHNDFDPYLQTWNRVAAFRSIGHPTDKIELIILGGTWSFHPESYQVWFVKRCFDALNDFGAGRDRRESAAVAPAGHRKAPPIDGRRPGGPDYNRVVRGVIALHNSGDLLHAAESASFEELARSQRANETAGCRSVGLTVETRPDHVDAAEVRRIRRLGGTKVQIGLQSLDDAVLARNRRGHDVAASRRALALLRGAGFKIHVHWMPNLCGATPASDIADAARLFDDPDFRPDELKVYPCSLVESAELMAYYERGEWRPYDATELLDVVTASLGGTPEYCRVTRVIRDFSAADIVVGNKVANLREVAERALAGRGSPSRDIRAREIRDDAFDIDALRLRQTDYATSIGQEAFLEWVTPDDRLVAFLRLSLPTRAAPIDELRGRALIREVHVYGPALPLRRRAGDRAQHRGLGRALVEAAAVCAAAAGYREIAVISAVGTRDYYRGLGFRDGDLYQHRELAPAARRSAG